MIGIIWVPSNKYQDGFEQLCSIIDKYENYAHIKRCKNRRTKDSAQVQFENGDIWKLTKVAYGRGYRCNISYIHRDICQEDIDYRILPSTTLLPYNATHYFGHYPELVTEEIEKENVEWAEQIWNNTEIQ